MGIEPLKMKATYYFEVSGTNHPPIQHPWRPKSSITQLCKPQNSQNTKLFLKVQSMIEWLNVESSGCGIL
jgi:hypothetical protein